MYCAVMRCCCSSCFCRAHLSCVATWLPFPLAVSYPACLLPGVQSSIPSRPATPAARLVQRITNSSSGGAGSEGAPQQHVDAATCALLDTAKTCMYRITSTYQDVLTSVVAKSKPLVGSSAEAQALLASFLANQE